MKVRNSHADGGEPFYHRLHIVQLRIMHRLTGNPIFGRYADRWESYTRKPRQAGACPVLQRCVQTLLLLGLRENSLHIAIFPAGDGRACCAGRGVSSHWARAGHEVTVLTGFPNHPTGVVPPEYRAKLRRLVAHEDVDGVKVVRTWLLPFPNGKAHERMLNYSSFCVSAATTGDYFAS